MRVALWCANTSFAFIAAAARPVGVTAIGVDEHVWRHTRRGDKFVTVIIDLTPIRDGTGPARLLDMVEGRSKQVFKTWLAARSGQQRLPVVRPILIGIGKPAL